MQTKAMSEILGTYEEQARAGRWIGLVIANPGQTPELVEFEKPGRSPMGSEAMSYLENDGLEWDVEVRGVASCYRFESDGETLLWSVARVSKTEASIYRAELPGQQEETFNVRRSDTGVWRRE